MGEQVSILGGGGGGSFRKRERPSQNWGAPFEGRCQLTLPEAASPLKLPLVLSLLFFFPPSLLPPGPPLPKTQQVSPHIVGGRGSLRPKAFFFSLCARFLPIADVFGVCYSFFFFFWLVVSRKTKKTHPKPGNI